MPPELSSVPVPSIAWALPFVALLLAIATMPLVPHAHSWWDRHHNKLALGLLLGAVVLLHYGTRGYGVPSHEGHGELTRPGWPTVVSVLRHAVLEEYIPFIGLLFSLYVISGGLQLRGDLVASPRVNTLFLAAGAALASLIGTTG